MQKLTKENIGAKQPAKGRKPTQKGAAPKPSTKPVEPAPINLNQDLSIPYYPGFLSSLPGLNKPEVQTHEQTHEQAHDLVPIYKVLEETVSNLVKLV